MSNDNLNNINENIIQENNQTSNLINNDTIRVNKKKWPLIVGIISLTTIALTFLSFITYFLYIYLYLSPNKFIDKTNISIQKSINSIFNVINKNDNISNNIDTVTKGNINVNIGSENIGFDFNTEQSSKNSLMNFGLEFNYNNSKIVSGDISYQDKRLYLNSSDIFDKPLYYELEKDILNNNTDTVNDFKYITSKLVEYNMESIKASNINSKLTGLNQKNYTLIIDNNELNNINRRTKKLVEKDKKLLEITKKYNIDEYSIFEVGKYSITINTMTNKIIGFEIDLDYTYLSGKHVDGKYIIKNSKDNNKNYYYVWTNDNEIKIEIYENNKLEGNVLLSEKKNKLNFNYSYGNVKMEYKHVEDNGEFILETDGDYESRITAKVTTKDNVQIINGEGKINADGETINLKFNVEVKQDENLVTKKNMIDAKRIDELTENEMSIIQENFFNLINKLGM